MPSPKTAARHTPFVSTVAILAAMAGLALAGCTHPANITDNTAAANSTAVAELEQRGHASRQLDA